MSVRDFKKIHRRDTEDAEDAQRKPYSALRNLRVLCVSAVRCIYI